MEQTSQEVAVTVAYEPETESNGNVSEVKTAEQADTPPKGFDCSSVEVGTYVLHAKFGKGKVVKIDKGRKYITIAFSVGEKMFVMPSCFELEFLKLM